MFEVGSVLNDTYRIVRFLGAGGMAQVFEVENLRVHSRLALKILHLPTSGTDELLRRFRREADIQARLSHPNLVKVLDWNVTADRVPYLIMELLSGEDLAKRLRRCGALPQPTVLNIFAQVAAALQHAHAHGVIHRDLKPANIYLCDDSVIPDHVKVLDFGIAKITGQSNSPDTQDAGVLGTPGYMAPEHVRGDTTTIGPKADQWALGLVLYEMLTGRPGFYRRNDEFFQTCRRILTEEPPPLDDPLLNEAVMRALRKDPAERYPGLSEFVAAVLQCLPERTHVPVMPAETARLASISALRSALAPLPGSRPEKAVGSSASRAVPPLSVPADSPTRVGEVVPVAKRARRTLAVAAAAALLLPCIVVGGLRLKGRPDSGQAGLAHGLGVDMSLGQATEPGARAAVPGPPNTDRTAASDRVGQPLPTPPEAPLPPPEGTARPAPQPSPPAPPEAAKPPPPRKPSWSIQIVEGLVDPSRSADQVRDCLRRGKVIDNLPPTPSRRTLRLRLISRPVDGNELLRLDPASYLLTGVLHATNLCLQRFSQQLAMVPEEVVIELRRH